MKTLKRIVKWAICLVATVILVTLLIVIAGRAYHWFDVRINTENGVDEAIFVPLNGQEQYLLIRGEDVANPVIIWLHGGPSCPDAYVNYTFQKYLTGAYTIVNWDQRGCGRTYFHNAAADPDNQTATFQQALEDLHALVDYTRSRFGQEKVILVGHSYGTMLGGCYALKYPDYVSAYIGVGQMVSLDSDLACAMSALDIAHALGADATALEAAIQSYTENPTLTNMMTMRGAASAFLPQAEKAANTIPLGLFSPDMGLDDLRWYLRQVFYSYDDYFRLNQQLYDAVAATEMTSFGLDYEMPVGFITGECDWTTPAKRVQEYHDLIRAPQKQYHVLDGCGHEPQQDDPEAFCNLLTAMLNDCLP